MHRAVCRVLIPPPFLYFQCGLCASSVNVRRNTVGADSTRHPLLCEYSTAASNPDGMPSSEAIPAPHWAGPALKAAVLQEPLAPLAPGTAGCGARLDSVCPPFAAVRTTSCPSSPLWSSRATCPSWSPSVPPWKSSSMKGRHEALFRAQTEAPGGRGGRPLALPCRQASDSIALCQL